MKNILLELHTSPIGGNLQFLKMYSKIKIIFFGKVLNLMFKRFVEECLIFQQNKVETINLPSLLQPFEIPCQCPKEVSLDFIISIPKLEGKNVITMFFYNLIKYAHFFALSHHFNASTIRATFMETIQKLHGNPNIIVND